LIYFDHTATTPLLPEARAAMLPYFDEKWESPGGLYRSARALKREVDGARRRAAETLHASPNDIVFTSSGTESINLAVRGVALGSQHRGRHLVTTQIEHRAVLDPLRDLQKQGWQVTFVSVDADGVVDSDALLAAVDAETTLVSVMLANNEVGSLQPIADIARAIKARFPQVAFHTDAAAAAGFLSLDVEALGVDLLSLSAHKIGGPPGAGVLWVKRGIPLSPLIVGGDQERGRRAGPENVPAIMGMTAAIEATLPASAERSVAVGALSRRLINGLVESIPGTVLTGSREARLPQIASFCFEGVDGEALLLQLDVQGIAAASGSACASATLSPSHVLQAMGVAPRLAEGNLRLSLGVENTDEEVSQALEIIPRAVERMRSVRR
jgi:cysteine desulfurase